MKCAEWVGRSEAERREVARRGKELAMATQSQMLDALKRAGLLATPDGARSKPVSESTSREKP